MQAYPLTHQHRIALARAFRDVPVVDISIDCVLEDQMGSAFVDALVNPTVFMIEQDGFFSYFAGDFGSDTGKAFLGAVSGGRLLMSGTDAWHDCLPEIYGERLVSIKRWQFSSDKLSRMHLKSLADSNPHTDNIKQITADMKQQDFPYLEIGAFDSLADFEQRGIGFCMVKEDNIVGVAYSSLARSHAIEVSIFVADEYRQQGVATALACQLLLGCLERGLAPHWDAANQPSCALAEKLGYTDKSEYQAYFLKSAS